MTETLKDAARRLASSVIAADYKPVAIHTYHAENGQPLYSKIRLKHPNGEKWIRPLMFNGHGWELKEPAFADGKKPVYNLHLLTQSPDKLVWITEGEQKADALVKLGLLATTSGGASSAETTDWTPLRGRNVILWPDNDIAGRGYAGEVATTLQGLSCSLSAVDTKPLGLLEKGDVVDWLAANPNATAADIEALERIEARTDAAGSEVCKVSLIQASSLKPEPIRWLWNGWLARGKFHLLAGVPGTGKTTIALAFAATVTTGGRWPDGTRCQAGSVLIWSGEDDPQDTLLPRPLAHGADRRKVYFVGGVQANGKPRPFDPAKDMEALCAQAAYIGDVRLLILDPVVNAVSGDSHKNSEVRRDLQRVADLAARLDAAALGITHFSKGSAQRDPVERVTGSIAFGALPRVVMATANKASEEGKVQRLVVRAKSNIGPDGGGFEYSLEQSELSGWPGMYASTVVYGKSLEGSARQLLADAEASASGGERGATTEAVAWLRELLSSGPVQAREVNKQARQAGINERALRRASERMGVKHGKAGFTAGWSWSLPSSKEAPKMIEDGSSKDAGIFVGEGCLRGGDANYEVI